MHSYLADRTQVFTASLTSTPPLPLTFGAPTRFRSRSSGIHRIHWNHYRLAPHSVPPICWRHTILWPLFRHWCSCCFIQPVSLCQWYELTLFFTLPAAQPIKNWIHFVWFHRSNTWLRSLTNNVPLLWLPHPFTVPGLCAILVWYLTQKSELSMK